MADSDDPYGAGLRILFPLQARVRGDCRAYGHTVSILSLLISGHSTEQTDCHRLCFGATRAATCAWGGAIGMSEQLLLNPLDVNSFDMNSFASGRALNANGNLYNVCNFLRLKSTGFPTRRFAKG